MPVQKGKQEEAFKKKYGEERGKELFRSQKKVANAGSQHAKRRKKMGLPPSA